jgi:hypothetical protein
MRHGWVRDLDLQPGRWTDWIDPAIRAQQLQVRSRKPCSAKRRTEAARLPATSRSSQDSIPGEDEAGRRL